MKMKYTKILSMILILLVLGGIYFALRNGQAKATGFAILEDSFDISIEEYDNPVNTTKQQAIVSLEESERIIAEMIRNDLPYIFINDTLLTARKVFEQAQYAEILRGEVNTSLDEKAEAREALRLLDWEKINYDNVIIYTNLIKEKRDKTFLIYDSLINAKIILTSEDNLNSGITGLVSLTEGINESTGEKLFLLTSASDVDEETKILFEEVSTAFYEEREDAEDLLIEFRDYLEAKKLKSTTENALKSNIGNFIQKYWYFILLSLIILGIAIYVISKKVIYRKLKMNLEKMNLERKSITMLIKEAQNERFKENKISKLVYETKMKKYNERLTEIKSKLPILESKLKGEKVEN